MTYIDITSMEGERPLIMPHLLPDNAATRAENCHFRHGVVSPVTQDRDTGKRFTFRGRSARTIFHYRGNVWFSWGDVVDIIRSPVARDPFHRIYFTDGGYPRVTSADMATQGVTGPWPAASYRLGVPAPAQPIRCSLVSPAGGDAKAPATASEPGMELSPNEHDSDEWVGYDWEASGLGRRRRVVVFKDDPYASGKVRTGYEGGAGITDASVEDITDARTVFYTSTYVTAWGEEGPPGPPSAELTLQHPGQRVLLQLQAPGQQNHNISKVRIYRSASGGGVSDYLLVVELPATATSFTDTKRDHELGPALETWRYVMPPDDMTGLCMMSNGIAAGFAGNELLFSEPYLPYAWPEAYRLSLPDEIVAIAPLGASLVVATQNDPHLFSGITPSSISGVKLPLNQACVSKQSMVALDTMVIFAGPDGLVYVTSDGQAGILTEKVISPQQWRARYNPHTLRATHAMGEYIATWQGADGSAGTFIINPKRGDIRHLNRGFDAAYHDPNTGALYVVRQGAMYEEQGSDAPLPALWRSKTWFIRPGTGFACLRVQSSQPESTGVILYSDGREVINLPPGTLSDQVLKIPLVTGREWQIEVTGCAQVDRITLASSMGEMPA